MLYKFKSKVSGDIIMTGPSGEQVLRALGREPTAQGIVLPEDMPAAIAALEAAIAAESAAGAACESTGGDAVAPHAGIGLKQRAWPLIQLFKRAAAQGKEVVWGV